MLSFSDLPFMSVQFVKAFLSYVCRYPSYFICLQFTSCTVFPPYYCTNKHPKTISVIAATRFHLTVLYHTLTTQTGSCDSSNCLVVLPTCLQSEIQRHVQSSVRLIGY